MWWRDDPDEWVSQYVYRLLDAWREGELPFATVIGSTWTERGERTLFVGVHPDFDPRPRAWAVGRGFLNGVARRLIRRYGPLPYPTGFLGGFSADQEGARRRLAQAPGAIRAIGLLLAIHVGLVRPSPFDLVMVPLGAADRLTLSALDRLAVPPDTQIGYLGPIRLAARKGKAVHRRVSREHATVGCLVATARGAFLTTAGHLGATFGETVYRERTRAWRRQAAPWGAVAAVTSPARPDSGSACAAGLDLAAIVERGEAPGSWQRVNVGDPRALRRGEYVSWIGAQTGFHEADLTITAAMAKADDGIPYEHALMATGRPPNRAGRGGDSGSAVYDGEGRLIGHFVGTEGGRGRGTAPNGWFQMIDLAHDYLEDRLGPIHDYYGDPRGSYSPRTTPSGRGFDGGE